LELYAQAKSQINLADLGTTCGSTTYAALVRTFFFTKTGFGIVCLCRKLSLKTNYQDVME
jgi:hypothetical protein